MKIDKKLIKELTDYLNEFNLTELEYGDNDTKIKVSKSNPVSSYIISEDKNLTSTSKKNQTSSEKKITSPIIGTAYLSPEPGAKKFIDLGKKIKKGDTVMIIEAMKTMNHVPSTVDGIVKEICVNDGSPVEFGQTIVILE
jgi:acetyl-CoA carboxylase biotin carboxyl carrier protein